MTVGPTLFALLVWGSILGVALVFAFEVYVLAREAGWLASG
jgi:hypothetical protein